MFITFGKPRSISELDKFQLSLKELKEKEKILFIDDQPFQRQNALAAHDFKITKIDDLHSLEQVEPYSIIACDIQGIGSSFESSFQGAHVISEIQKTYPDKYLIAFTGASHNALYSEMLKVADLRTQKGADMDAWTGYLELAVKDVGNPRNRWIRMRRYLISEGYDAFYVLKIEQAYIKSIITGNPSYLKSSKLIDLLPDGLVSLIAKFTATAVVELIKNIH